MLRSNKEKEKTEYNKNWKLNNKEKISEYNRKYHKEYYQKNKNYVLCKCKKYRSENKEKIKMINKEYRENNKENAKVYQIEWRKNNKEAIAEMSKKNRKENEVHIKTQKKIYYKLPPGKFQQYRGQAKSRGIFFNLSFDEFMMFFWKKDCYYCGSSIETVGIDRVDNNRGYEIDNCVSCCITCNKAKNKMPQEDFYKWVFKLYRNIESKKIKEA